MTKRTLFFTSGEEYGYLTVLSGSYYGKYSILYIQVKCWCGVIKYVRASDVKAGKTTNCGCIRNEKSRQRIADRNFVHGLTFRGAHHEQYSRHASMMDRCYNIDNKDYVDWGGRGIQVFEGWHDPVKFCEWVDDNLGSCPKGMSIDRIDNDDDYRPGNVRWATAKQQNNNKRNSKRIKINR